MTNLKLLKRPKRDTTLTVRLPKEVVKKLRSLSKKNEVSQADIIELLIEDAYEKFRPDH